MNAFFPSKFWQGSFLIFTFLLKVLPVPLLGCVCCPQGLSFPLFKDVFIPLHS